jgi:hypothetical protein
VNDISSGSEAGKSDICSRSEDVSSGSEGGRVEIAIFATAYLKFIKNASISLCASLLNLCYSSTKS